MIPKILVFIITYKASHRVLDVVKKIPFGYLKKYNYQILINDMKYISEIPIKTFYGTERFSVHIIYAIRFFLKILKFKIFKTL